MKKSTVEMMHAYLNGQTVDLDTLRADVNAEYERLTSVSKAKTDAYTVARPVVLAALSEPMTVKDVFEKVQSDLPEGFTAARVQYGLLNYWADEVVKQDCGKNANLYVRKA